MSSTVTLRLDDDTRDRLQGLADATQRSRSFIAAEAIRQYVIENEWQVAEVTAALVEADNGDFATARERAAFVRKWKLNAG